MRWYVDPSILSNGSSALQQVDEGFKFYRSLSYLLARIKPWASLFETTNKETVNKSVHISQEVQPPLTFVPVV